MKERQNKISSTLFISCINVNRSTNMMHALAHNIATWEKTLDILLIQEPWWNGSITTSFQGWQVILPTPTIKENECPRVVAYYWLQAGIEITLRMDICSDLDFMILDVRCSGLRHPPTHLINIYNQMELGELQESVYTTDRLASIHLTQQHQQ